MKKNISQNLFEMLKSKGLLAISSGLLVISCGIQMGGYSETDGVYYDPNKDTLPEGVMAREEGNRVGEYYDYQDSIRVSEQDRREYDKRYVGKNWKQEKYDKATSSDWGTYSGSETHYYGNDWGYPYGYGYGYYPHHYGWGGGYGMSFGWGNPYRYGFGYDPFFDFGYSGFYSPYYGGYYGYNPYYGYYSPYYGGGYYGGYNPYYGYGYGYNNPYYYRAPRRASSADGYYGNPSTTGKRGTYQQNSGFRNGNTYQNGAYQNRSASPTQPRVRATEPSARRTTSDQPVYRSERQSTYEQPSYRSESQSRDFGGFRNDSGGFRSGGSDSGSSRSGGGFRTGGGR